MKKKFKHQGKSKKNREDSYKILFYSTIAMLFVLIVLVVSENLN
jgi:hypothetical protein